MVIVPYHLTPSLNIGVGTVVCNRSAFFIRIICEMATHGMEGYRKCFRLPISVKTNVTVSSRWECNLVVSNDGSVPIHSFIRRIIRIIRWIPSKEVIPSKRKVNAIAIEYGIRQVIAIGTINGIRSVCHKCVCRTKACRAAHHTATGNRRLVRMESESILAGGPMCLKIERRRTCGIVRPCCPWNYR